MNDTYTLFISQPKVNEYFWLGNDKNH